MAVPSSSHTTEKSASLRCTQSVTITSVARQSEDTRGEGEGEGPVYPVGFLQAAAFEGCTFQAIEPEV
jgi:hypothetical protein